MRITLGRRYRDLVTGFEGIAVSRHEYLQGCARITLEKLSAEGDKVIDLTFDEPNLELLEGQRVVERLGAATGGPHDHLTPDSREV